MTREGGLIIGLVALAILILIADALLKHFTGKDLNDTFAKKR